MTAGAQCKHSTGLPIASSSFQARMMAPGAGGQFSGGKVRVSPFGSPLNAIEMPPM